MKTRKKETKTQNVRKQTRQRNMGGGKERETNEPEGKHRRGDEETQIGVTEERNKTSP